MTSTLLRSRIDTFVEAHTEEPFYYSQAWHNLIRGVYGYAVIPLIATDECGRISGFLPLCYVRSRLTGSRLVSLPFSDTCPLLASDERSANALVDQAICLARSKKVKYLELRTGRHDVLSRRSDLVAGNLYVRWLLDLSADSDVMLKRMHPKARTSIRKAQRHGVQVRLARDRGGMAQFYRLHLMTRNQKHGVPAQPWRYFAQLWDTFAPSGTLQVLLADHQGTVIAGTVWFTSGATCRAAYGAADPRYIDLAPNHLLQWEELRWAARNGYRVYDFGRTATTNEGLMAYKRHYGATAEPIPYYYYPGVAGAVSTSESNWKYRIFTDLWRRLPLEVAGPVGGFLYPHLA